MNLTHDIFAEVNPAYSACALQRFTKGYAGSEARPVDLPIAYVALPLALSADLASTFEHTNKNTGLAEWLERNPGIQIDLAARLNGSMHLVTLALRFACFTKLLEVDHCGKLHVGSRNLPDSALKDAPTPAIKYAERLGHWCSRAGAAKSVLDIVGLTT